MKRLSPSSAILIFCTVFLITIDVFAQKSVCFTSPNDYLLWTGGSIGEVVVRDFNSDGIPDIFAGGAYPSSSIAIGVGDGTFEKPVHVFTGFDPAGRLVSEDFNGDGNYDLAFRRQGAIGLIFGDGLGGFSQPTFISLPSDIIGITAADYNNDLRPDLAASGDGNVFVLLNQGDGGFSAPAIYNVAPFSLSLVSGDFNNDNNTDIAVGDVNQKVHLFQGDGTGQFIVTELAAPISVYYITSGYVDDDDNLDLVVENLVYYGNGNMTFSSPLTLDLVDDGIPVVADMNKDGNNDVIQVDFSGPTVITYNNGNGTFSDKITYYAAANPGAIAIADLDNNGFPDAVVTDETFYTGGIAVLLNSATGLITFGESYQAAYPNNVAIGDFDGDLKPDILATNNATTDNSLFKQLSDGSFGNPTTITDVTSGGSTDLKTADFDGDGNMDFVVGKFQVIEVRLGDGSGGFSGDTYSVTGSGPQIIVAHLNSDDKADIAVTNHDNTISIFINNGDGTFASKVDYSTAGGNLYTTDVTDIDGDLKMDLVASSSADKKIYSFHGNGDGTFNAPVTLVSSSNTVAFVRAADADGDGLNDIIFISDLSFYVVKNEGGGNFSATQDHYSTFNSPKSFEVSDFNGDGRVDIALILSTSSLYGNIFIHMGIGGGKFSESLFDDQPITAISAGSSVSIAVADIDNNGSPDIVGAAPLVNRIMPFRNNTAFIQPLGTTTFCSGSVTLQGPANALDYAWIGPDGDSSDPQLTVTSRGTYTLTVTNNNGSCSSSNSIAIHSTPAVPTIHATQPDCTSAAGSIDIISDTIDGDTFSFDNGANFQSSISASTLQPGGYHVIVKDVGGCSSLANDVTINPQPPLPSKPVLDVVNPSCLNAVASITVTAQQPGDLFSFDNGTSFQGSNTITGLASDVVHVLIRNSSVCVSEVTDANITAALIIPSIPDVQISDPTCDIATGSISITTQRQDDTYSFDNGVTFQSNNGLPSAAPGNYTVAIKTTDGCTAQAQVIISRSLVKPVTPTLVDVIDPSCITPAGSIAVSSSTEDVTYSFDNGETFDDIDHKGQLAPGLYHIFVKSSDGCESESIEATIHELIITPVNTPEATVTNPDCSEPTGIITITIQSPDETYSFDNGDTFLTSNSMTGLAPGIYHVIARNHDGCKSAIKEITIADQPEVPTQPDITATTSGTAVSLKSSDASKYEWLEDGNVIGTATTQTYQPTKDGSYTVIVTSADGCESIPSEPYTVIITGDIVDAIDAAIYPNPAETYLYYNMSGSQAGASIINSAGKNVELNPTLHNNQLIFYVKDLSPGIYILRVTEGDKIVGIRWAKR